ncbi:MAG: T9SS type A sorting domain-containing protein [Aureispira sp.]|nr:T9SS type A sorting domain-containing protein [Aureispira sp.]
MNKYIIVIVWLLLPYLAISQGGIVVDGANFNVEAGTQVRVEGGGVTNQSGGDIDNEGNIYLDLDWVQNGGLSTYTGGGWMWFEGTGNQSLFSAGALVVPRLRVDNGQRLVLLSPVTVSTQVDLMTNGNIELGANDLTINPGGTIVNYNAANFVVTNGTGSLKQEVAGANVVFPVGETIYNPATLNNAGTTDNISVRVVDQVQTGYPVGGVEIEGVVGKAWFIEEDITGGSDVTLTLQWDTGDELPNFDRTVSGISHWTTSVWDRSPTWTNATNVGGTSWTQTRTGITYFSPFAVEDIQQDLPVELLDFTAKRVNADEVQLDWSTATEINNKGFEVQRMLANELEFETFAWVDGAGTTTDIQNYDLLDENNYSGTSYYRLKQVDNDGTFTYSQIRAVDGIENVGNITVFPNPTETFLNIRFAEVESTEVTIRVYAADGKLVINRTEALTANQTIRLEETQHFAAGAYLIQMVFDDGTAQTKRFIKSRN